MEVLGAAAGTTMLPVLTRQVQTGADADAHRTQTSAIEYALVLTLPAALALGVLAVPILATLFGTTCGCRRSRWRRMHSGCRSSC